MCVGGVCVEGERERSAVTTGGWGVCSALVKEKCPPAGVLTACNTGPLAGGVAAEPACTDLRVVQVGFKPVPQVHRRLTIPVCICDTTKNLKHSLKSSSGNYSGENFGLF